VLLRKRIGIHYPSFDASTQINLKSHLLNLLSSEGSRTIRHSIATVVASVFKTEAGENSGWLDLFTFIQKASGDVNPEARELAFFLLNEMSDTISTYYKIQLQFLVPLFTNGLNDASSEVQVSCVKALGQFMTFLVNDAEIELFAPLIPLVLNVSRSCHQRYDEETLSAILDIFYDLSYSQSKNISVHLPVTVQLCLEILKDGDLEMGVRDSAALVIATLAETKPKRFGKEEEMVNVVVETLFQLIESSPDSAAGALFDSNPSWKDDDDEVEDEVTQTSMAQGTLDMLACELPKKSIFTPVMVRSFARMAMADPNCRKAGVACIGVIAEGCNEPMRENLNDILPRILESAKDTSSNVRECACFALGQLSEHCQPEVLSYADQILPVVFSLLDDPISTVQTTSCYVLEMFCERLEPSGVRPLLDPLVRKLANLLETSTKRSVQEMAVAALAATAVAAEDEFAPYVSGVTTLMGRFMILTDETKYSLRGRALECMGHLAIAVGKDNFRPYFQPTMACACEGLTFDNHDLHEFAYAVFANLAKVMGEEFAPVLTELVPHLVNVIDQEEGQLQKEDKENAYDLDDSDDEDGENYVFQVRSALLEAKKGAITALGEMAAHTGPAYVCHLEESMRVLQKSASNWHPLIKGVTAEALPSMIQPSIAANHAGTIKWNKGEIGLPSPLSPHTASVVSAVLKELLALQMDEEKGTVGKACESIQSVIETCGPHAFLPIAQECLTNTHKLLIRDAPCCTVEEDLDVVLQDDFDDHDSFMTNVCDLVGGFVRVMGPNFSQYLPQFIPPILEFAKSSRPASDKAMAMGCFGEICQESGASIAPYWQTLYPALMSCLVDSDDNVKRNSVFFAGVCCEGLGETIVPHYPELLQVISPIFAIDVSKSDASAAAVDNAAAAVSRMIMTCPTAVPINQVLPVLLRSLPLKNDMTENETVYKCLLGLIAMNHADLAANQIDLRRVFEESLKEESMVDKEIKGQLQAAFNTLSSP